MLGSPDENSQSSLSSSPKAISCPPTSHPNISPVDKSASSKFLSIGIVMLLLFNVQMEFFLYSKYIFF